jgi:hypothetical protein
VRSNEAFCDYVADRLAGLPGVRGGAFSPDSLRAIGWPGEVFGVENLLFYLAGIPTYILAPELALNTVPRGDLPRPAYPEALQAAAPPRWWGDAQATLAYGRGAYAARGRLAETAGTVATAACQAAHAVLAPTGQ